jgi:rhodanese-related sulfurtransferase
MSAPYFLEPQLLFSALLGSRPPVLVDVRRRELVEQSGRLLPASRCHDHEDGPILAGTLERDRPVVVACAHGRNRSQRVAAHLRAEGFTVSVLRGGYDAWVEADFPPSAGRRNR